MRETKYKMIFPERKTCIIAPVFRAHTLKAHKKPV